MKKQCILGFFLKAVVSCIRRISGISAGKVFQAVGLAYRKTRARRT